MSAAPSKTAGESRPTVRAKLAAILREELPRCLGFDALELEPQDMWSSRSPARRWDDQLGTWGGKGVAAVDGGVHLEVYLGSYDTMTACVRRGIVANWRGTRFCSGVDVIAALEQVTKVG